MGYNYYASATFPASARRIPEIAKLLDGDAFFGELSEENGLICVSDTMAGNGGLCVTPLLVEHRVPYDHYHRDDNACKVWTDMYRVNDSGELVEVCSTGEHDEELSNFAKCVLKALENGKTEEVYALLNNAISPAVESIEENAAKFTIGDRQRFFAVERLNDASGKRIAGMFFQELLDSVETLGGIVDEHGSRTLADLMYLQNAILNGGFIDYYPGESKVLEIASALPSGDLWSRFIKVECLAPSR
jgi:hypothetical protein